MNVMNVIGGICSAYLLCLSAVAWWGASGDMRLLFGAAMFVFMDAMVSCFKRVVDGD